MIFNIKALFSIEVIFWFLFIVLLMSILASFFVPPSKFKRSRMSVFVSILASIAVFFMGISLLMSTYTFEQQQEINFATKTKESIDKLWLYPNQLLVDSRHARDEFLKSFYPNTEVYSLPNEQKKQTIRSALEEQNIAVVFLQAWEDFLTIRNLEQIGDKVWLTNFLQWAQSPYLEEYFHSLKYNYRESTIELARLLFEYAKTLPIPTKDPELYRETVEKMLKDPRLIDLFKQTSRERFLKAKGTKNHH